MEIPKSLSNSIFDEPWLVLGDFNTVIDDSEVCGQAADTSASMNEFRNCIMDAGLLQLPFTGCPYTWHNCSEGTRSLWKRLDRMLVNEVWLETWPSSSYTSALPSTSDNSPLIINGANRAAYHSVFRFENYLAKQSGFLDSVKDIWRHKISGTTMYEVVCKLKALKCVFHQQRKLKGTLTENVRLAKSFLDKAQKLFEAHKEDYLLKLVNCRRQVYSAAVKLEMSILTQRAKLQWIEEGGLGIKDILALNRAPMSKHLWAVIKPDRTSIWVNWIIQVQLRDCSIWTWEWDSILLWHDLWHPLGPLISRFPRGPQMTRTGLLDKLSVVIKDRQWNWHLITDIACLEITHMLPLFWRARTISVGSLRTATSNPRQLMIFSTTRTQVALPLSDNRSHFHGPRDWQFGVQWASSRWRGKHVVNAAYRSLLASLVYHIWQERNTRRFQQRSRSPSFLGKLVVEEIRQRIISVPLRHSVSSLGLFRLWKIPWPAEGFSI
ncbi:hypothetical protein Sango_3019300 [Sesamum angolense]|uniref:Reverse transcriptase n=1 Tax=Sesamum angolense TaxID=2727404 RepID=A0AAE1VTF8_9LAMI|nr:hypothetical protein Sango_3019300 [Sesamum angolense]